MESSSIIIRYLLYLTNHFYFLEGTVNTLNYKDLNVLMSYMFSGTTLNMLHKMLLRYMTNLPTYQLLRGQGSVGFSPLLNCIHVRVQ